MPDYATYNVKRIDAQFKETEFRPYLDSFKYECLVRNLTPKTIDVYYERLGYFFSYLQRLGISVNEISKKIIQDYILSLMGHVSEETINGRIRTYRRFFGHLVDEGLWEHENPMVAVRPQRAPKHIRTVVEPEIVQKLIGSLNRSTFEGNRNVVLLLLLWDGMLRKKELMGLITTDVQLDNHLIKVYGKGRKERMVPLGKKTLKTLHHFLLKWRTKYPGDHVICMRNGEPLKERHCHKIVQDLGKKQGIRLYPHLLRHSAATWYIQQGGNPAVLQRILGHSSLLVTQNYVHLSSADAVKSYEAFSPSNCLRI